MKSTFVLWQIILFCGIAEIHPVYSQQPDSTKVHLSGQADTTHQTIFPATNGGIFQAPHRRSIDLAITGGAGYYRQGTTTAFQPTANADFFAQTSNLDLTAGLHWGFSNPSTAGLSLGLRFPIQESDDETSGIFADAALLFTDNGTDTVAFSTGLRAALATRTGPFEFRIAGEVRRFPSGGDPLLLWGGIELGFVLNVQREDVSGPTPKDSLHQALRYIATSDELDQLDKTTSSMEIGLWLDTFWQKRNVTGSSQNDAREEYMHRVRLVNEKYGTPRMMGVSTDQGRVYLLYGKPDQIEAANSINGADRRFELWTDDNRVQGHQMAFFLFVSSQYSDAKGIYEGHGDYREIYSNVGGEPSDGVLPSDLPVSMQNYIESFR